MPADGDVFALPKVDLHVHLEGSMRPSTVVELAATSGADLPEGLRDGRYGFRDFRHFIDQWVAGLRCLTTPADFRRIAYELSEDEAAQGVRYAEVSFSLPEHAARLDDWDGPVLGVLEGFADGERDFGIVCRPYVDVVRGLPVELSWNAMRTAVRHREGGVIGVGLGGDERHPPEDYAQIFAEARSNGLHSLPHAGETAGPASIRGALDALGAERLGHGIRCLEDPDLAAELRDRRIALEVCPTSNVMTRVVRSIDEHPLPRLLEAGLLVTLNSDDPSMFSSPIAGEYELARRVFGLDDAKLAEIARNGVRASFAPASLKAELERGIDAWLAGPGDP
ncbi:MAG: adenosine deaminase [Candidatus Velamenicoccus archaeovorus]